MTINFRIYPYIVPVALAAQPVSAQLLRPYFVTPEFSNTQPEYQNWEYTRWDKFYTPHDGNGTLPQNRNYPDMAAPNGYATTEVGSDELGPLGDVARDPNDPSKFIYVGPFNGEFVWSPQNYSDAVSSGFTGALPTNPSPAQPRTIFHTKNPSIRQHSSSAFIIGPGFTGNIYSFSSLVSYTLDDSLDYDAGAVVFQFQNQGRDIDMDSIFLRYTEAGQQIEISATDMIIEREAFASHAGFTFTTRSALEWDLSGKGVRDYQIVWKAAGTSCSVQEILLDTADAYVRDRGLPAKRLFTGAGDSNWDNPLSWEDVAGNKTAPEDHANLVLKGGNSLDIGATTRKVSMLQTELPGDFVINGSNPIELGTGLQSADSETAQLITLNVPVHMTAFNFFDVGANVSVAINGTFSGETGFEKRGTGSLSLAGNNTFTGALFVSGGKLNVSGNNVYGQPGGLDMTYIYLGELELESGGVLGRPNVKVAIGSTPYEVPGESRPSSLVIKGERDFNRPIEFTGGYNPKRLAFTDTGAGAICSAVTTLHNGTELGIFGIEPPTGEFSLDTPLETDQVTFTNTFTGGATLDNTPTPHALHKTGLGKVVFSNTAKAYKHQTKVEQGTLLVEASSAISGGNSIAVNEGALLTAEGPITLTASKLTVNGRLNGAGTIQRAGAVVIGGGGIIEKSLTIDQGTSLSPGDGVGSLTLEGSQTWGTAGKLTVDVMDAEDSRANDFVDITGTLSLTNTPASPFTIELKSHALAGTAGKVYNFNGYGNYAWTLCSVSEGITGFNAAAFTVNASGFTNTLHGTFSVEQLENSLILKYTANTAPTPSYATWAAALPAGLRGEEQDADGDGVPNLVEFATGTNGNLASDGVPRLTLKRVPDGEHVRSVVDFTLAEPFRPGVVVQLMTSPDLKSETWVPLVTKSGEDAWQGTGVVQEAEASGGKKKYTVTAPDEINGEPVRFFRLRFLNQ